MLKIKISLFILVIIALTGCNPERLAYKYLPTVYNASTFPNGAWIIAELTEQKDTNPENTVSGELISLKDHKLYILGAQQVRVIPDSSVHKATLYMYKKQPGVFAAITVIGILPNLIAAIAYPEYAGTFLALGIIPLVSGTIFTITEATTKRNQLVYPGKNSLDEFNKFARFPQGIPTEQDIYQLKLPELK